MRTWTAELLIADNDIPFAYSPLSDEVAREEVSCEWDTEDEILKAAVAQAHPWFVEGYEVRVNTYKTTKAHGEKVPTAGYKIRISQRRVRGQYRLVAECRGRAF